MKTKNDFFAYFSPRDFYHHILGTLPLQMRRTYLFWRAHKRWPDLQNPVTFSEKIAWRILHDRRPIFDWTCDKFLMKQRVLDFDPNVRTVPTLWFGENLASIDNVKISNDWVFKPNSLSGGLVKFGAGHPVKEELEEAAQEWTLKQYRHQTHWLGEWAYSKARMGYLLEPRLPGPQHGIPPTDYKVFVFDGEPRLIQVHQGRGYDHQRFHLLPNWDKAPIWRKGDDNTLQPPQPPRCLDELLTQASNIGKGFDFMRVDFYIVNDVPIFGETSPYPASGLSEFFPESADTWLGNFWKLPALNLQ